jgi:hypothetical protein
MCTRVSSPLSVPPPTADMQIVEECDARYTDEHVEELLALVQQKL